MKNFLEKTAIEFCNSSLSPNDICLDAIKKSQNGLDYRLSTLDLVSQLKNEKVAANMSQQFYDLINSLDQLVNDDSRNKNKTEVDNLIKNGIGRLTNYSEKVSLVNSVNTAYSRNFLESKSTSSANKICCKSLLVRVTMSPLWFS